MKNYSECKELMPLLSKIYIYSIVSGLFDKAKKKILGDRDDADDVDSPSKASTQVTPQATSLYDVDYWGAQEIGEYFNQ